MEARPRNTFTQHFSGDIETSTATTISATMMESNATVTTETAHPTTSNSPTMSNHLPAFNSPHSSSHSTPLPAFIREDETMPRFEDYSKDEVAEYVYTNINEIFFHLEVRTDQGCLFMPP